jgi:hypothetical protein
MAFLAQEVGCPSCIVAEDALIQAVCGTRWLHELDAARVCDYLVPRWRRGEIYDLNRGLIRGINRRLSEQFRELPAVQADLSQLPPHLAVEYEDFAGWFRDKLPPHLARLFDFWVGGPERGWQARYSEKIGHSPPTTSRHLADLWEALSKALSEKEFDCDPKGFVWRLSFLRGLSEPVTERPPGPGALPPAVPDEVEDQEGARLARECLREALEHEPAFRPVLQALDNLTERPGELACLVAKHAEQLDAMHRRFVDLRRATILPLLAALNFYRRLGDTRVNLLGALARAQPPRPAEDLELARQVTALARQEAPVAFADLEVHLGLGREVVVCLLNDFRCVYNAFGRARRGQPTDVDV